MTDSVAILIAIVCLYSTGHWIGATVLLVPWLVGFYENIKNPTGTKRLLASLRKSAP